MNIWLVTIGEPVPVREGVRDRLHRTGYFAHLLAKNGHNVIWWTSTFNHFLKQRLFDNDTFLSINERLQIRLLHGCGYRNNVSFSRIRDHKQIAKKFSKFIRESENKPDVIVSAFPTIELCLESVKFGKQFSVPVVLDMRDMWPDIFVDSMPGIMRPFARMFFSPMFKDARVACAQATAITGITEGFVEWGLQRGQRHRTIFDRSFPMGYVSNPPSSESICKAEIFWDEKGITVKHGELIACFFGTLGRQFDLDTVIMAVKRLNEKKIPVRFILCGSGDRLQHYKQKAEGLSNIVFPGWVDASAIYVLMRRADIGITPMPNRYDFLATINNKAIEYMSAGLPIVSSPAKGTLYDLLAQGQCGLSYDCGDVEGLTKILLRLCDDRNSLKKMAENSARLFRERFVAEKVYGEMKEYLENVVATYKKHMIIRS